MARRALVGLIWCVVLYFAVGFVVGNVTAKMAAGHVEPGQDPAKVATEAGTTAVENSRQLIIFAVVTFVFITSHFGYLPGTRIDRMPLLRR